MAALYILPHQLSRDHRQTVHRRMACTLGYSCLAWMPVYKFLDCQVDLLCSAHTYQTFPAFPASADWHAILIPTSAATRQNPVSWHTTLLPVPIMKVSYLVILHTDKPAVLNPFLHSMQDVWQLSQQIGLRKEGLSQAIFYPLLTTGLLFLGPLIQRLTSKDDQTRYPEPLLSSPAAWRDLFVAPLTEEFVFRCLVIAILLHMVSVPLLFTSHRL